MVIDDIQFEQTRNLMVVKPGVRHLTGPDMTELTEEMSRRMRCDNIQHFVLDMSGVEFVDSASIGALVTLLQDLEHVHGRIALTHCQPNVAFLFKVTRLDAAIPLFDETEEAIEEFL